MTDVKVLGIGTVSGGPGSDDRWATSTMALSRRISEKGDDVVSPVNVLVAFQIPGRYLEPDFDGMRTGRYSAKDRQLTVQVALPATAPDSADAELVRLVEAAIGLAEEYAERKGLIDAELSELRELVARL